MGPWVGGVYTSDGVRGKRRGNPRRSRCVIAAKETLMAKGQEKPGKNNKPKLTTKEKQQKKKEKAAGKK